MFGVPQGSKLVSILFNIYICDMFFEISECDIVGYADDNTPYTSSFSSGTVVKKLELSTKDAISIVQREPH